MRADTCSCTGHSCGLTAASGPETPSVSTEERHWPALGTQATRGSTRGAHEPICGACRREIRLGKRCTLSTKGRAIAQRHDDHSQQSHAACGGSWWRRRAGRKEEEKGACVTVSLASLCESWLHFSSSSSRCQCTRARHTRRLRGWRGRALVHARVHVCRSGEQHCRSAGRERWPTLPTNGAPLLHDRSAPSAPSTLCVTCRSAIVSANFACAASLVRIASAMSSSAEQRPIAVGTSDGNAHRRPAASTAWLARRAILRRLHSACAHHSSQVARQRRRVHSVFEAADLLHGRLEPRRIGSAFRPRLNA